MRVNTPADIASIDLDKAWRTLAEAGLLAMRARDGGAPMSSGVDVMFAVEELGAALAPAPLVGALLATELFTLADAPAALIDTLTNGEARYAIALSRQLDGLADASALAGVVCFGAEGANAALALKRDGEARYLVVLPLANARVLDGADPTRRLSAFTEAPVGEVVGTALSQDALDRWTALALALVCADMVGAMRQGLKEAVEYAKTRIQYDVPIGSFQAVQHMLAEMLVQTEAAASVTRYAAWSVDALGVAESLLAARTAKAYCGAATQVLSETLMQSYGGIGQTWEHVAHLRARRALFDRALFGDESHQLLRIADARMGRA
ncbi:short-chain-acyl-CoA dehydrogenase [alpha proteobacterium U9-1i]|nr:short-chain-acyl-CoA dehydrogenase [alpha proteobacterium U9-1i]